MSAPRYTLTRRPCDECGQPASVYVYATGEESRPWCDACVAAAVARHRAARAARTAVRDQQFPDLPPVVGGRVVQAGIDSRAVLARRSDAELLATPGLGPHALRAIRAVFPAPCALTSCPRCGGTGWLPREEP